MFDKFKIQVQSLSQGAAQDNLNQEKLSKIEFAFPSLSEQQKIASFHLLNRRTNPNSKQNNWRVEDIEKLHSVQKIFLSTIEI